MRLLATKASVPGRLNCWDSASPAGFVAAIPAIAMTSHRPTTSRLWASTHRVRFAIALRSDIGPSLPGAYVRCKLRRKYYTYAVSLSSDAAPRRTLHGAE